MLSPHCFSGDRERRNGGRIHWSVLKENALTFLHIALCATALCAGSVVFSDLIGRRFIEATQTFAVCGAGRGSAVRVLFEHAFHRDVGTRDYWDGNDLLGIAFRRVLGWKDQNAWDVYMLYGSKARWTGDLPPAPDFSMNQDAETGPRLNAAMFGTRVRQLPRQ